MRENEFRVCIRVNIVSGWIDGYPIKMDAFTQNGHGCEEPNCVTINLKANLISGEPEGDDIEIVRIYTDDNGDSVADIVFRESAFLVDE